MTVFRRRIFPHVLLAVAALSVALPLALVGCGGGEQSPSPAATSPATPAAGFYRQRVANLGTAD